MAEYVKKRGKVIVININPEKDKTMVQELLYDNWKEEIGQYLKSYFRSNDKFVTCEGSIWKLHKAGSDQTHGDDCKICVLLTQSCNKASEEWLEKLLDMYGHGSSDEIFKPKCELKYQNNLKDFKLLLITELDIAGEAFRPDGGRAAGGVQAGRSQAVFEDWQCE